MKVEGGAAIAGTLEDCRAARDFASLLPLELTLTDYAATEKISDLPRRLNTEGAPRGVDPDVGDFGYSEGLVRLGRIDSGVTPLKRRGPLQVTVELIDK